MVKKKNNIPKRLVCEKVGNKLNCLGKKFICELTHPRGTGPGFWTGNCRKLP